MSHLDRLIAQGTTSNFAAPVIQGLQARGQLDTRDLANTQARNTIERQSNVNRLLQKQGQQLLGGQPQNGQLSLGGEQPSITGQSRVSSADRQNAELLIAAGDVDGLNKLRQDILGRQVKAQGVQQKQSEVRAGQESGLRKEFDKASGEFKKVSEAYQRILNSASDPSAAGDLALIFNFMKVLDPGSTVREGEFATAQNAAGVDQRIISLYNQVTEGTRLTPKQRGDFVGRAGKLFGGAQGLQQQNAQRFTGIAERGGLDPQNVVFEFKVGGESVQKPAEEVTAQDFENMDIEDLRDFVANHPDAQ